MQDETYPHNNPTEYRYEFTSVSANKSVRKVVLFTETENENLYNLALMDVLDSGELCDKSETKNQDMRKVIATTYDTVKCFLELNKAFSVIFSGSEEKRQRLYRIAVSTNLTELSGKYLILGLKKGHAERFQPNHIYDHYIISNKL
ncbi:DUF6934 family protein [Dyadobacter sp. CY343]|uniref:DUF6934 family protein n=1 Tax=Dyadobacter sp. CY343 TaxID=2907299 RepID=UPI001F482202|nr:hypothetical protein [Dyadobacter sp. CY343]MCE7058934.1 hypothetical protein [Dyadobacter sp. CY343]